MACPGKRGDDAVLDLAQDVVLCVGNVDRAGARNRDAFGLLEKRRCKGTIGQSAVRDPGQSRDNALRCHAFDLVVARVGDVQRAVRIDGQTGELFEPCTRSHAVHVLGAPGAGHGAHDSIEGDAAENMVAAVGDIDQVPRLINSHAARVLELCLSPSAVHESRLAAARKRCHLSDRGDELDGVMGAVGHNDGPGRGDYGHSGWRLQEVVCLIRCSERRDAAECGWRGHAEGERGNGRAVLRESHVAGHR